MSAVVTGFDPAASTDPLGGTAPLYRASDLPALVELPPLVALMVDGVGDPDGPAWTDAVSTLYAVSYGLRFGAKAAGLEPWKVAPLEGLWWADDPAVFRTGDRSAWRWTAMILQPPVVTAEAVLSAAAKARESGKVLAEVRLAAFDEGRAMQVMHHGPYDDEGPTIAALHAAIADAGLALAGAHHEIYLSDPRRTAPERMRTILRQPVASGLS